QSRLLRRSLLGYRCNGHFALHSSSSDVQDHASVRACDDRWCGGPLAVLSVCGLHCPSGLTSRPQTCCYGAFARVYQTQLRDTEWVTSRESKADRFIVPLAIGKWMTRWSAAIVQRSFAASAGLRSKSRTSWELVERRHISFATCHWSPLACALSPAPVAAQPSCFCASCRQKRYLSMTST